MGVEMVVGFNDQPPRKRGELKRAIDWLLVKQYYVQDESLPSYYGLAKKFDIDMVTVIQHSNEEGWIQKREDYWNAVSSEVFKKVKTQTIARRVTRYKKIGTAIDRVLSSLLTKKKVNQATANDLWRLLQIEAQLIEGTPAKSEAERETVAEIISTQILRIKKIEGGRGENLNQVLNAGLRRLGILQEQEAGDGDSEKRQGVRVRHSSS